MTKINDSTYDFVRSIYMKNVPLQSELTNPFAANKRQRKNYMSNGMADLANVYVVHPRDQGSYLSTDRKYFLILLVSHLNSNM
jgi:hypothetical protein